MSYIKAVENIYSYRYNNILIGLTGRTGSGCSTVAKILSTENFKDLALNNKQDITDNYLENEEILRNKIVFDYLNYDHRWKGFHIIEVSAIILTFILEGGKEKLINYIEKITQGENSKGKISISSINEINIAINGVNKYFDDIKKYNLDKPLPTEKKQLENYLQFYLSDILGFKQTFKSELNKIGCYKTVRTNNGIKTSKLNLYTFLLQKFGNNLRASGNCYNEQIGEAFTNVIVERIDKIVEIIDHQYGEKRVCIDALRNPMEILFFKDRYKNYYTFSINVDEDERCNRLSNLSEEELKNLDKVEYPQKYEHENDLFFHQDIQKCIELADIHINNPKEDNNKYFFLTSQLTKYIALIIHPGLISPSNNEYCMQVAFNAKLNSGCLSRQVGAVITSKDYSIKAVGWNDTASKQTPCNLRTIPSFCSKKELKCFSEYELSDKNFEKALQQINLEIKKTQLYGMQYCYCFKDIYNAINNNKNQVHTRSLHAEENAFLQISKNGGVGIKGGKLFVTASPCELCSKKSFQLGIEDIYYIDPYPGIAKKHILSFGNNIVPRIHLFSGAVGEAFVELFCQRIAQKDELALITGMDNKKIISEIYNPKTFNIIKYNDIEYNVIDIDFRFLSRTEMVCKTTYTFTPKVEDIKQLEFLLSWTGSNIDEINCKEYSLTKIDTGNETSLKYCINFNDILKKGNKYTYTITTKVRDLNMVMLPHFIQRIKFITKKLKIIVRFNKNDDLFEEQNVIETVYADLNMSQILSSNNIIKESNGVENLYKIEIKKPILNYCYGIEWNFKK